MSSPAVLVKKAFVFLVDMLQNQQNYLFHTQARYWSSSLNYSVNLAVLTFVSWLHPPLGVLMLNFDGSVQANVAFVIHDYQGKIIAAGGKRLRHCSVVFAELVAA